jgi:hypothetical protein
VTYLVEVYLSARGISDLSVIAGRVRTAACVIAHAGGRVRCLRSIYIPGDETLFLLYDAPTIETVEQAVREAELESARVVRVILPS